MKRLSKPLSTLKDHYEVVVVGSGYGGSIAASRFARAGMDVCLLEKGKEFLPGEFPRNLNQARKEIQFNKGNFELGSDNGLYDFVIGDEITVFKGCGLGGTSLVNANVSIEGDPRIFEDERWPLAIRNDLESVKEGILRARDMLKPVQYPEGQDGYPVLKKTEAMRKSASFMNEEFRLLNINVNFKSQVNHVGVNQPNCTNCGDCVTGCNRGAKNTTAMNYLPDAFNHGAAIFTGAGVSHVERKGNKWIVFFNVYQTGREKFDGPLLFTTADIVIISGGSLGSTEILLRSAQYGLDISQMIGHHFTGNGDVLGFSYNNDVPIHGMGKPSAAFEDKIIDVGPCITSVIDMRKNVALEDGMTLEEGSVPGPIRSIMVPSLVSFSRLIGKDTDKGFKDYVREKWRELISLIRGSYKGAVDHTQIYLVMSNDDGNGVMRLENDKLVILWDDVGKQKIFQQVNDKLESASKALGGNFVKNPTWTKLLDYDLVTVHPLGGCVMGEDATGGVVDHKGQVFKGKKGKELYPGLYVMDGAILPRPVGTNPLLTISGLSERNSQLIARDYNKEPGYAFDTSFPDQETEIMTGVQFTETMKGYFGEGEDQDYEKAFKKGKENDSPFEFTLTIQSQDAGTFVKDKEHLAGMFGTMTAPKLSPEPLMAYNGSFNLFIDDDKDPGHKKMLYRTPLLSIEGHRYYFEGYKDIFDNKGLDVWKDTTTLFITLYEGDDASDRIIGKGILKIEIKDFIKQMTTMKALNASSTREGLKAVAAFGKFFAGNVYDLFIRDKLS